MPWVGRTDSLCINGDQGYIESIVGRLCLPAPLLQSLTFNAPCELQDGATVGHLVHIPPGFLGERVPSLRNLAFLSVSPSPVTSIPLQHLASLEWTDSFVVIKDLFAILTSAPLVEEIALNFRCVPMPTEPLKVITLGKLRKLVWDIGGTFSLAGSLIAPELDDLKICMNYGPTHNGPSIILPPHREHVPLLAEPTALKYLCHNFARTWDFTYTSGRLRISKSPEIVTLGLDPPPDHWLSPSTPISFGSMKQLVVEGFGGYPLPSNIPIEQFGSLESLKLVGEVDRLLYILQPTSNATGGTLVPFLTYLELHTGVPVRDIPFEVLAEILRERKEAGREVKTVRILGEYEKCPSELVSGLTELVDILILDQTPPDAT